MDRRLIKAGSAFQNWDMSEAAFHTMNHSWINNSSLPGWDTHTHWHLHGPKPQWAKSKISAKNQKKRKKRKGLLNTETNEIDWFETVQLMVDICRGAAPRTDLIGAQMDICCAYSFPGWAEHSLCVARSGKKVITIKLLPFLTSLHLAIFVQMLFQIPFSSSSLNFKNPTYYHTVGTNYL